VSKVADHDSCDARVSSPLQNVSRSAHQLPVLGGAATSAVQLHLEAVSEFRFIQPCNPMAKDWLHEPKLDG
jgi:hypothetical protein